jgi:hypothetical protein
VVEHVWIQHHSAYQFAAHINHAHPLFHSTQLCIEAAFLDYANQNNEQLFCSYEQLQREGTRRKVSCYNVSLSHCVGQQLSLGKWAHMFVGFVQHQRPFNASSTV